MDIQSVLSSLGINIPDNYSYKNGELLLENGVTYPYLGMTLNKYVYNLRTMRFSRPPPLYTSNFAIRVVVGDFCADTGRPSCCCR